jgi:hypothetical protein
MACGFSGDCRGLAVDCRGRPSRGPAGDPVFGRPCDHGRVTDLTACPVCGGPVAHVDALALHLVEQAEASDGAHVMWLNRQVTKHRTDAAHLAELLRGLAAGRPSGEDRVGR